MSTFEATIVLDSINESGDRLTTALLKFPRVVLSEFNTHRVFSRNSASSRAIPVAVNVREVLDQPYFPPRVGVNRAGMQATEYLEEGTPKYEEYARIYYRKRDLAVLSVLAQLVGEKATNPLFQEYFETGVFPRAQVDTLLDGYTERTKNKAWYESDLNIHKQHVNRGLEEFMWHTVLVTANSFENFFALRNHPDADPAIEGTAKMFQEAYEASTPQLLKNGEWHLPLIQEDELEAARKTPEYWVDVSVGRCARTSYLTHFGTRDPEKDIELARVRLAPHGHMSPFEHAAQATNGGVISGNFVGFEQYRKRFKHEDNFANVLKERNA